MSQPSLHGAKAWWPEVHRDLHRDLHRIAGLYV
jgi:hypothetical protein